MHLIDRFLIWEFLLFSCMLIKPFPYMVGHDIYAYSTSLFRAYVCSAPLSMAYMLVGNLIGHGPYDVCFACPQMPYFLMLEDGLAHF